MTTGVEGIRRRGFLKWYERELLAGHANLVLLLLAAIGMLGSVELFAVDTPLADRLVALGMAIVSAAVAAWALRRYVYLLQHAEFVASQASCPSCQTYARWDAADTPEGPPLHVRCRHCAHEWQIDV